jgi:hypothetical protein
VNIKVEDLKAAFAVIDNVAVNPVLESSQFVRIRQDGDKLTLALTGSLWSEATVKGVTTGGKWIEYADRRLLKAFMSSCSSKEVDVFLKPKEKLTFKADQRLEVASHAPVQGYESWAPKAPFALTTEQRSVLAAAVKYLPLNMAGTENMSGVWFGKDCIIATDSISMIGFYGLASKDVYVVPAETAVFLSANDAKVSVDDDGVGAAITNYGYVYQPRSTQLDAYPHAAARAQLDAGLKAKPMMSLAADDLLGVLRIASGFIFDKNESCRIEMAGKDLLVTVDMAAGKFQRTVKVAGALPMPVDIAVKRIMPWLEYADDKHVEYAKLANCSMLRFSDGKRRNVLLVADV